MKFITLIFGVKFLLPSQNRTQEEFYYGVNGRPVQLKEDAVLIKEVAFKSDQKRVIVTRHRTENGWETLTREKARALNDGEWVIRHKAEKLFSKKFYRSYTEEKPGTYLFREYTDNSPIKKGISSRKFPLHLEGTHTEYFPGGAIKSISEFRDNQLISNQNWLEDGTPYIDTVFYSADREPEFEYGPEFFKSYLVQRLSNSGWDISQIQDQVIIGWVVMEDGHIDGVTALQGKSSVLNQYLVESIAEMPGQWQPATLNGSPVRYFMSIPLNFVPRDVRFQDMGLTNGQLYYSRY
jgi:hypothetical protein